MILILFSFFADSINLKLLKAMPYDLPILIEINGNFLYTCGGDFSEYITSYSLDNPYHPQIISQCIKDVSMSKGKMENSQFLYYNDRLYKSSRIINVEDPYNIFHEGEITPDVGIRYMQIRDTILFVDCVTWAPYEIHTYSLLDPSSPLYLSMYESSFLNPINEQRFFVLDTLCFITDGLGFEIVNVRNPEDMYIITPKDSIFKNQGYNFDIVGKDTYLYLLMVFESDTTNKGDVFSEETLFTIDCSKGDSIVVVDKDFIGTVDAYPYYRLSSIIKDTLLYILSDPSYDISYIASFSLSNPNDPLLINEYYGEGTRRIEGFVNIDYSDSLLYVSRGPSGILVHDPSLYERGYSCYSGYTERIIQKNNIIYTGTYGSGVRIFKETSDTIYELTHGGQRYDITDISIFDTLLYAISEFGSFLIFSIKDSLNSILLYEDTSFSFYSDSLWCEKIAVDTECIYLTRNSKNLAKFYILDRNNYSIISTLDSVYGNINIKDTIGFVGDKILNISDKTNPYIITDLDGAYYNALKDSLLYLSNGKLFSVAKIDSPVLLSTLERGRGEFRGDSLYICDGGQPSEIYVYDISKPDSAYLVAYGNRPTSRQEIWCVYPTLNRKIFTDGCFYIGFIEQGGVKDKEKTKIPSSIVVDYLRFNFNDKYSVSLYDITGRKILNKELEGEGKIYVRDLSQGVYFISIPEKNLWKKILVLH